MITLFHKHPHFGIRLKTNRILSSEERINQLLQKKVSTPDPHFWGSIIKFNNTFIELIDINYQRKGFAALMALLIGFLNCGMIYLWLLVILGKGYTFREDLIFDVFSVLIMTWFVGVNIYLASLDFFTFTHCPIRLNRRTQMVHVMRLNGTILSIPWGDPFFTLQQTRWMGVPKAYIAAHVLDESKQIIKETFVLGGYLTPRPEIALSLWEYCRRYMEEGPEFAVEDKLMYCLPIDKQKESFDLGDTLIRFSMWVPGTRAMGDFMSIILFGESLARWLATMTCRIPKWPKEIEDVCKIEPDDPYVRDGSTNDVRASLAPAELGFR